MNDELIELNFSKPKPFFRIGQRVKILDSFYRYEQIGIVLENHCLGVVVGFDNYAGKKETAWSVYNSNKLEEI